MLSSMSCQQLKHWQQMSCSWLAWPRCQGELYSLCDMCKRHLAIRKKKLIGNHAIVCNPGGLVSASLDASDGTPRCNALHTKSRLVYVCNV
jgi:hypothetical protein